LAFLKVGKGILEAFAYLFVIVIWIMANPLVGLLIYFLPLIIALIFSKRNAMPIVILNILLGWFTPLWLILFVWGIFGEKKRMIEGKEESLDMSNKSCQYCAKLFPKTLERCPHCGKDQLKYD
jgi:hypothetical protein